MEIMKVCVLQGSYKDQMNTYNYIINIHEAFIIILW